MTDPEHSYIKGEPTYYCHVLSADIKKLYLMPISDVHYGNPLFSPKHFEHTISQIQDNPDCYTVLNGDLCESGIRTSKGEIFRQVGSPQDQRDWIVRKLLPIRHKILGMTTGNHENRIYNEVGVDISSDIAKELHVPYRAEGLILKITFGDGNPVPTNHRPYSYFLYMTHGYGGARTAAAKAVKLERVANSIHADIYLMSHDHVVNAEPVIYLVPEPKTHLDASGIRIGHVRAVRKLLVKTNAYLKWGGYSEVGGFSPTDLFTPIVQFNGEGFPGVHVLI